MYILPAKYNYVKKENENIFTYYFLRNYEMPRQGWKIHISSSLGDAQNIITIIANYCYANNISFKHVRDEALYLENISSEANSAESGKLITIYPQNEQHALKIMSDCAKLLSTMAGPNILSDYQFKNSKNVFFRYGLNYASKNRNPDTFNLISPKGEKQPDSVQPFPKLPKWIQLPQNWVLNVSDNDNILKYHPFAILKRNNGGNTYLGKNDNTTLIIKEARKYIQKDKKNSVIDFKRNEWDLNQKLNRFDQFEKCIDHFTTAFAEYFIYQKECGQTVTEFISTNSLFVSGSERTSSFLTSKKVLLDCSKIVQLLHHNNIKNIDVHSSNFILSPDDSTTSFIDLEAANINSFNIETPGYSNDYMKNDTITIKDIRRIGFLTLYLFGQSNRFADILSNKELITLCEKQIMPFGKVLNLKEVLNETLLSPYPSMDKVIHLITGLYFQQKVDHVLTRKINPPLEDEKSTLKYLNYKLSSRDRSTNLADMVTGLNGIGGVLLRCSKDLDQDLEIIKTCNSILDSRITHKHGNQVFWRMDNDVNRHVINPYISDGVSGALIGISSLPVQYWPKGIYSITASIAIPYAKNPDYFNGLLGIADAILTIANKLNDISLYNQGYCLLEATKSFSVRRNGILSWPIIDQSSTVFGKSELVKNDSFEYILKKWGYNDCGGDEH